MNSVDPSSRFARSGPEGWGAARSPGASPSPHGATRAATAESAESAPTRVPARVGVLGGGRMGSGIAHAFAVAGARVIVVERDRESADASGRRIRDSLRRTAERSAAAGEPLSPLDALSSAFTITTDMSLFESCGLVIEAVPEDRALKAAELARAEAAIASNAVLATNTSSIPIEALAESLARPERFLGLHFFNPVPSSQLVEIIVGSATDSAVVDEAYGWVSALGKRPIVVRDSPGFASSRLGVMLGLEAIRMLEEGVASAEDIDAAMELGYRHPIGPLRTTDIVGLDVRLAIAEELERTLGPRYSPPELLRRMVAEGDLGRKTGRGFYEWNSR